MKRQPSEHEVQSQILQYLTIKGIFCWRSNTGAMRSIYKGKARFMRFGVVGSPDIFAVVNGNIVGIEVKGPRGKLSAAQDEFGSRLIAAGGSYIVAFSLEDVTAIL